MTMAALLWIAASLAVLLLAGVLYQVYGSHRDRTLHTGEGRTISIANGSQLYLYEQGHGQPTVIFEAGIGATHLNWRAIQQAIAADTRTVSYDRCGLGWSSCCRTPRTPANIAAELHETLARGGFKPPFILVGHSFGGLVMRRFALLYPQDVTGLVLVDPMRCKEWPPYAPQKQSQIELGCRLIRYAMPAAYCGLTRLLIALLMRRASRLSDHVVGAAGVNSRHVMNRVRAEVRKMPRAVWPAVAAHWARPDYYKGIRRHIVDIPAAAAEMHSAEPIPSLPITVLTPGRSEPLSQQELKQIGDCAQQQIASKSAHWIHLDEPELTIGAIRGILAAAALH